MVGFRRRSSLQGNKERLSALCVLLTVCMVGVYEVGVHIADVSYFVESGTPLDREAARRATSVYMVQKVCHTHTSPYVIVFWVV